MEKLGEIEKKPRNLGEQTDKVNYRALFISHNILDIDQY